MWPNPQFPEDLVKFTEEILNEKFHFLRSVSRIQLVWVEVNQNKESIGLQTLFCFRSMWEKEF